MADRMSVRMEGVTELRKRFGELAVCLDAGHAEPIILQGAQRTAGAARAKAPYDPKRRPRTRRTRKGELVPNVHLRDAIVAKTLKRRGRDPAPAIAAVDRKLAPHAHLLEYGTAKMAARPFLRPAWNETKVQVLSDIVKGFRTLILFAEGLRL